MFEPYNFRRLEWSLGAPDVIFLCGDGRTTSEETDDRSSKVPQSTGRKCKGLGLGICRITKREGICQLCKRISISRFTFQTPTKIYVHVLIVQGAGRAGRYNLINSLG
jgi:hypothetical protein